MTDSKKPASLPSNLQEQKPSRPDTDPLSMKNTGSSNKIKAIQAELNELLSEKKKADASLAEIEFVIYNFEGSYLKDTHNGRGNLLRGFGKAPKSSLDKNNQKIFEIREEDRIFSRSSMTFEKSVEMKKSQGPISLEIVEPQGQCTKLDTLYTTFFIFLLSVTTAGEVMDYAYFEPLNDQMNSEQTVITTIKEKHDQRTRTRIRRTNK
ncbi:9540_t:CDS:2 [Ambispora gerdemannii]|uniref:Chromatin modification-related protein EAF6 n=1 Tax=Ambispora gerdemannii TaxID=144530 RepID=A0A9N9D4I4_9GLOM|nr:9540_t:CDS:2 [Ambispora gerdemannii]